MRKVLYGVLGLVVVLVAVALVAPSFIDWNAYKDEIQSQARAATGRDLVIAGDIDLAILPMPTLSAADIRVANIPGAAAPNLLSLRALEVRVALMPLLSGQIEVKRISLVRPVLELEVLADGRVNWGLEVETRGAPSATAAPEAAAGQAGAIKLEDISIENGTVVYRDSAAGRIETIDNLNAQISAESLAGPFRVDGRGLVRGIPMRVEAAVGQLVPGRPTPISLGFDLEAGDARLELAGTVASETDDGEFTGTVRLTAADLADLVRSFTAAAGAPAELPGWLAQAARMDARLTASSAGARLDELELEVGGILANGAIAVTLGEPPRTDITLAVARIDLDRLLRDQDASNAIEPTAGETIEEQVGSAADASSAASESAAAVVPQGIEGSVDIGVDAVVYRGGVIREVRANLDLANGEITLNQVAAHLPGGTDLSVFGFVSAVDGETRLDGTIEITADDLRGLFGWLGINLDRVPQDRLRKFTFSSKLAGTPELIQLSEIAIGLDASRATGGLSVAVQERPSFGLSLDLDRINLDAYLPVLEGTPAGTSGATAEEEAAQGEASPAAAATGPLAGLSALETFDANVGARIGRLTYQGNRIQDISFDGTLYAGVLTVRNASVGDLAGARARFSGSLGGVSTQPTISANLDVSTQNLGPLAKLAGIRLPVAPERLGPFAVVGKVETDGKRVGLDVQLTAVGAQVTLKGSATGIAGVPNFDLSLGLLHPDLNRMLDTFEAAGAGLPSALGPLSVTATLKSGADGALGGMVLGADIDVIGGRVHAEGQLTNIATTMAYDLGLALDFPDIVKLARILSPDYRPGAENLGGLKLSATARGNRDAVSLSSIAGNIGPVNLEGEASASLTGPRSRLTVGLRTSEILADLFLPVSPPTPAANQDSTGGTGNQPASSASASPRWSTDPIDFSGLRDIDATLELASSAITYGEYRVVKPQVSLALSGGVLEIKRLTGEVYGGTIDLAGRVDGSRSRPTVDLNVEANGLDAAQIVRSSSARVEGKIALQTVVAGAGQSERELVGSLNGQGALDGDITLRVSGEAQAGVAVLGILSGITGILTQTTGQANAILSAFSSSPAKLQSEFTVERGIVRLGPTSLQSRDGIARVRGVIDLPAWVMDTDTTIALAAEPETAALTVKATGPIDEPNLKFGGRAVSGGAGSGGALGLLEQIIPGVTGQQQQPADASGQNTTQQPQEKPEEEKPQKPADFIKGILKGLGG